MHARHAHDSIAGHVIFADAQQQALVVGDTSTHGPLAPSMKATARYCQASAHQLNRINTAAALTRLKLQLDSLAKSAAASRKKSRSFFTRASSRFSVAIS